MRRVLGGVRLTTGILLAGTLIYQITDLAIGGGLIPWQYFSFFTVDSTIIEIGVLVVTGLGAMRTSTDTQALTSAAMSVVPYAIVVCLVYNLLLRGSPTTQYLGQDWHNEVVHVAAPLYLALDWFALRLLDGGRPRLRWRALGLVFVFPVLWFVFTMVRGAIIGYYPYPFLDVANSGVGTVIGYTVGLFALMGALAAAAIAVTRARRANPAVSTAL
jgi:hypothetical protein